MEATTKARLLAGAGLAVVLALAGPFLWALLASAGVALWVILVVDKFQGGSAPVAKKK